MKLSFALSLQKTDFDYIAKGNDWQKNMALLADMGYQGVELGIRNPQKLDRDALKKILDRYQLQLCAIGTGQAFIDEGLSLSSLKKELRERAIERIERHIDLADFCGGSQVIIGLIRGKIENKDDSPSRYEKNLLESTKKICDYAVSKGITLAIEPLNRYETGFLHNTEETVSFIKKIKCKNLKILLDSFHMNIEENNLLDPIRMAAKYLSHFHLADNNRRCPGEGCIDFKEIIAQLKRTGYAGYLSGEMLPAPSAESCINRFHKVITPYLGGS